MILKTFPCGHRRIKVNQTKRGDCRRCVHERVSVYQKAHPDRVRASNIASRLRNPRRYWERKRRWKHGPNAVEHYEEQLKKQRGLCALCLRKWDLLNQDHNHRCCSRTKKHRRTCGSCSRGLLCHSCNRRLGHLEPLFLINPKLILPKDNQWLRRAYDYVFFWDDKT